MTMRQRAARIITIILAPLCFLGCDQDPLHLSCRAITGNYCLELWEDGHTYYIDDIRHTEENGGGVVDGTVLRIGWNQNYIVVLRHPIFGGDKEGWMIIDVKSNQIHGPTDTIQKPGMREVEAIPTMTAADAWRKLGAS